MMNRISKRFCMVMVLASVMLAPAGAGGQDYETTQIAEGVYQFRWAAHNGLFVVTPDGVVVFDPISADAGARFASEIRRLAPGVPLRAIVYSHDHADHATGARALMEGMNADVPIIAHERASAKVRAVGDPELPPPTLTYRGRSLVLEGERPVELHYLGRSHSDNMTIGFVPDVGVAFAVDFVSNDRVGFRSLPDYHFPEFFETLGRLLSLPLETIVFGHGPPGDRVTVQRQIQYYDDLRAAVRRAVAEGWSEDRAAAELRLPAYEDWGQYEAWFPMNVRAIYRWMVAGEGR